MNPLISRLVFGGGIPENGGRVSREKDRLTEFESGTFFPGRVVFLLNFGLKIISPSECDTYLSLLSGMPKLFVFVILL